MNNLKLIIMIDLNFHLEIAKSQGIEEDAFVVIKELGIEVKGIVISLPHDITMFQDCHNVPKELPDYLEIANGMQI